jgi:pyruvate,water dikinase
MTATAWVPPGPGEWIRLADHFDRPWTAQYERVFTPTFREGFTAYASAYGMPVRMIDVRTVHGYAYMHVVPAAGPDSSRAAPATLLWLLARTVPALRAANRRAARTLASRPWIASARAWWEHERADAIARNRALAAADLATMSDHGLAEHLEHCEMAVVDGYRRHFEMHGTDLFPIGLLLSACRAWGIETAAALDLIVTSTSASSHRAPLDDDARAECIVGGYDLDRPRACELPDRFVTASPAWSAPAHEPAHPHDDCAAEAAVAEALADPDRDAFRTLLSDARTVYPVRDDNGLVLGAWRMGLLRRAFLAAGARLGLDDVVVEATVPELVSALRVGRADAIAPLLRERAETRRHWAAQDPPLRLGRRVDPPLHALPTPMRTVTAAQMVLRDLVERAESGALTGFGVGSEPVTGRACVARDAGDAIERLADGDLLVVRATSPAFNAVLPFAGGLVVEHGGLMSHAAVAARELGLPAVIGVAGATDRIPDGALVELDPVAGVVHVRCAESAG